MNQVPTELDMRVRESAEDAPLGIGEALKRMREARNLTLPEVSARIKYSSVQLAYLEAGDWPRLPDGVPLRGLVRNYARFLETDVDAMLSLLDDEVGSTRPRPTVSPLGGTQALRSSDLPSKEPAHRTWFWLLLILVLLCVAGLYAVNRGWVPDEWLVFEWLKALKS